MKRYVFLIASLFFLNLTAWGGPAMANVDTSALFRYDGYMNYQSEPPALIEPAETLTLEYSIAPASWETVYTGIVSEFSPGSNTGYDLSTGKYRSVAFRFGTGTETVTVQTRMNVVNKNEWNTIYVNFDGAKGRVEIYVNGTLIKEEQVSRGSMIQPANVDKRIGCNYDRDTVGGGLIIRNVFDGYIIEGKAEGAVEIPPARDLSDEANHPAFHAAPVEKWMNEPHAPFFYNGKYHLFFQSNPHGPYFNNLNWGHWVSEDMVNWTNLPVILEPEYGTVSPDGCWSGGSVIGPDGSPLIFYTAGDDSKSPNQMVAIARPEDLNDENLTSWKKDEKALITQEKPIMRQNEFRDPFVFIEDGKYWCIVGTGDSTAGCGNAGVYVATDEALSEWEYKGFLMDYDYIPDIGRVWELPVLLPVKGGGDDITHVLTVCACRIENGSPVKTYYWLGRFDSETGKFVPQDITPKAIDSNALSIGGTGFVTPDGRSVLFLIAQGKRSSDADGAAGYAHCAAFPLELWVEGGELQIKPIEEVKNLRGSELVSLTDADEEQVNQALADINDNEYEIVMELPNEDFTMFIGNKTLSYYKKSSNFGFRSDAYAGSPAVVKINGDIITLRVLVDRSLIECFFDEQAYCATRVYTKEGEKRSVSIMIDEAVNSLVVYKFIK
jgi:sucrose-6-phosphate hydrolase SacC (GH32 family)